MQERRYHLLLLWITLEIGHVALSLMLGTIAFLRRTRNARTVPSRGFAEELGLRFGLTIPQFQHMTARRNVDLEPLSLDTRDAKRVSRGCTSEGWMLYAQLRCSERPQARPQ